MRYSCSNGVAVALDRDCTLLRKNLTHTFKAGLRNFPPSYFGRTRVKKFFSRDWMRFLSGKQDPRKTKRKRKRRERSKRKIGKNGLKKERLTLDDSCTKRPWKSDY